LSVRDCLTFTAAEVSEAAIVDALRDVGLYETIDRAPAGLDTELSTSLNGGIDLSGGQWQRLAVARLLLHLPVASLAIIDEPTTALDPVADRDLSDLILDRCAGMTTLIVSHRLHFAPRVTQVALATSDGHVEVAPHQQLVSCNSTYRTMLAT
jgi:ATP-binding cassette, subfamily B, bacterial